MSSGQPPIAPSAPILEIKIAPHETNTDYLKPSDISIGVRNRDKIAVVLEELSLTFQSNYAVPRDVVTLKKSCDGCELAPDALDYFHLAATPSLLYRPATNYFDVSVVYRYMREGTLSAFCESNLPNASYLVVKRPPVFAPARVFVSYKDPEDAELSNDVAELSARAGLEPYLARTDPRPGSDYWPNKIEPAIRSSVALFVIWTSKTEGHDESVVREVRIARDAGVPDVLLLEKNVAPPKEYPAAQMEHVKFVRDAPWVPFAGAIEVISRRIRAGKGVSR